VATPKARPDPDALTKRAATLQAQNHFRYPLSEFVAKRVPASSNEDGDLLMVCTSQSLRDDSGAHAQAGITMHTAIGSKRGSPLRRRRCNSVTMRNSQANLICT
jgi:hypothetical protein